MAARKVGSTLFDLSGKTAVVTGAGRGLGLAIATGLARAGAKVLLAGRTRAGLDQAVAALADQGLDVLGETFEATCADDCANLARQSAELLGSVDILVISHGIGEGDAAENLALDQWRKVIDVDLTSAFVCAQAFGRSMLTQGSGSIIFISSTASLVTFPGSAAYGAAKAGVDHLCRHLASEWASRGVRVNAVNPGFMTTHMRGTEDYYEDPSYLEQVVGLTPMQRKGEPHELVGPVIFLASAASSFVTGHILPVDGGWCLA